MMDADLTPEANLSGAYLPVTNLTGADLRRAFLNGANLSGAALDGVISADFTGAFYVPAKYLKR